MTADLLKSHNQMISLITTFYNAYKEVMQIFFVVELTILGPGADYI